MAELHKHDPERAAEAAISPDWAKFLVPRSIGEKPPRIWCAVVRYRANCLGASDQP